MKLSNKILVGFFGFIFLYLTAAFAELRLTGIPNVIDDTNSIAETADLSGVRYLILNDAVKNIEIVGADRAQLEVRSFSGGLLEKLKYGFSGDTLTLSGFESEDINRFRISIFVPKGLKGIIVNNSAAAVRSLELDHLYISLNSGRAWMSDSRIAKIEMDVSNKSYLDISGSDVDTLSATIEESRIHIYSPIGVLQGSMKNSSFLQLNNINEIQLKKDENSRLNLY